MPLLASMPGEAEEGDAQGEGTKEPARSKTHFSRVSPGLRSGHEKPGGPQEDLGNPVPLCHLSLLEMPHNCPPGEIHLMVLSFIPIRRSLLELLLLSFKYQKRQPGSSLQCHRWSPSSCKKGKMTAATLGCQAQYLPCCGVCFQNRGK